MLHHKNLDLSDLQDELTEHLIEQGINPTYIHNIGFGYSETLIRPEYESLYENPTAMIIELGFNKISDYCRERNAQ